MKAFESVLNFSIISSVRFSLISSCYPESASSFKGPVPYPVNVSPLRSSSISYSRLREAGWPTKTIFPFVSTSKTCGTP